MCNFLAKAEVHPLSIPSLKNETCTFAACIILRRISEGNSRGAGVQAKTIIYALSRDGGGGGCLNCSAEVYPPTSITADFLYLIDYLREVFEAYMRRNRVVGRENIAAVFLHHGNHTLDFIHDYVCFIPVYSVDSSVEQ